MNGNVDNYMLSNTTMDYGVREGNHSGQGGFRYLLKVNLLLLVAIPLLLVVATDASELQ